MYMEKVLHVYMYVYICYIEYANTSPWVSKQPRSKLVQLIKYLVCNYYVHMNTYVHTYIYRYLYMAGYMFSTFHYSTS